MDLNRQTNLIEWLFALDQNFLTYLNDFFRGIIQVVIESCCTKDLSSKKSHLSCILPSSQIYYSKSVEKSYTIWINAYMIFKYQYILSCDMHIVF